MNKHLKWLFAVVLAAIVVSSLVGGSAAAVPKPSCPVDEYGNCMSVSCYDVSCIDGGYDVMVGDETWGDSYDAYSNGGQNCAYAGAHRERHAPIGHLWTMYFQVYYCWNGSEVTKLIPIGPWGRDFIGSPWNQAYGVSFDVSSAPSGLPPGNTYAYSFTQMSFLTCFIGKPVCAPTKHPWIEIIVYATGYAACWTDVDFIGGCRGVKYK